VGIEPKQFSRKGDLELLRAAASPVLGRDRLWDVFRYNLAKLLFVDLLSKGFVWVVMATWVGLYVMNTGKASDTLLWGYGIHVVLAFFYWAARGQFAEVVTAACDWLKGVRVGPPEPPRP
jgi:hypothetical protein